MGKLFVLCLASLGGLLIQNIDTVHGRVQACGTELASYMDLVCPEGFYGPGQTKRNEATGNSFVICCTTQENIDIMALQIWKRWIASSIQGGVLFWQEYRIFQWCWGLGEVSQKGLLMNAAVNHVAILKCAATATQLLLLPLKYAKL